jgi:hypothetical protein
LVKAKQFQTPCPIFPAWRGANLTFTLLRNAILLIGNFKLGKPDNDRMTISCVSSSKAVLIGIKRRSRSPEI